MKGKSLTIMLALVCMLLQICAPEASAEQADDKTAWTVLIYMCGSDLESRYSYGTENLEEITKATEPDRSLQDRIRNDIDPLKTEVGKVGNVKVLVETGGAKEWHADKLGMNISPYALQDWEYLPGTAGTKGSFEMKRERPLTSMADPETLTDFIRWGKENYPAEKYMLVLWDHGGGSATGILIDELFGGEYMTLDMLNKALGDGGVHFEAVLFDACLMANIETAAAIKDHASWMIASEELVAGKGTAFGDWLQELYYVPICDGRMLGRWICDTAMIKYANSEDSQAQDLLTWSVIDLDKVEGIVEAFDNIFARTSMMYVQYPETLATFASAGQFKERFGTGHENMFDFGSMLYNPTFQSYAVPSEQLLLQEKLAETVDYCVRGSGRAGARGISFCFATNFTPDRLDIYARNCPSPHFLALLDAISVWEAPDWVYEKVDKIPEPMDRSAYQVGIEKTIWEGNGSPAFRVTSGEEHVDSVYYSLYQKDELTGEIVKLGRIPVYYDTEAELYRVYDLLSWASIEGNLCQLDAQNVVITDNPYILYNIPVMIDSDTLTMRGVYWFYRGEYEILGLWDNYDGDSSQFNRNVKSLVSGREFSMLYEVKDSEKGRKTSYLASPQMMMYRALRVEETILPPGTYYLQYVIMDGFLREMPLDTVELSFDGQEMSIVGGDAWEGTATLDPMDYYAK